MPVSMVTGVSEATGAPVSRLPGRINRAPLKRPHNGISSSVDEMGKIIPAHAVWRLQATPLIRKINDSRSINTSGFTKGIKLLTHYLVLQEGRRTQYDSLI